ncbi:probable disease resistance RPP8-like protein 2 [Juglans microcarpa x Juglans regia]|uniref:probable disease resistance RPP8-like protein 2 n=1 Tax=Juglans microcarpa x Juglans regia TaxID=2249226 RepID=UPI001B7F303A|nr:probable disease resistance RPP8-like protein 2 [Juglans microcarpa x Juglans regia]
MRDFCVEKAKLENFLNVININDESNEEIEAPIGKVRRVAISGGSNLVTVSRSQKYFHLRSLLTFPVRLEDQKSMLRNIEYLRVLNFLMNRKGVVMVDFPAPEIKSLIHLRFLSLRNTGVTSIPSLGNCLQTLDLRSLYYHEVNVPNKVFRNMEHLQHLFLPQLSKVRGKLQLPNVSKLQTLVNINPVFICDVKDPTTGFDKFGKNLMPSDFTFNCLHVLKISQNSTDKRVDITPVVMRCPHIYQLRILKKIEKLPEHDKISPHLVQLKLNETGLEEDPMSTLEKLPNLKILHLASHAYTGNKMICSVRGFPQLQSLILVDLNNLEEWEVEQGSLPRLCHLKISSCCKLRMVPDGVQFVTTLQKLEIIRMPESFADRLGEGGQDFYKIRHLVKGGQD